MDNHNPRPPVNQGIDLNHPLVLGHRATYEAALASLHEGMKGIGVIVNPYGTAPLAGYIGMWSADGAAVQIELTNDIGAIPAAYSYTPKAGANLIPLLGLLPAAINHLKVTIPGDGTYTSELITAALPISDKQIPSYEGTTRFVGFPLCELTVPAKHLPANLTELYFLAIRSRGNIGLDHKGMVRWYTSLEIPSFNTERLSNGHFMSVVLDVPKEEMFKTSYEFDLIGRIHKVYRFDHRYHHSIWEMPGGQQIMASSENTPVTSEDGVAVFDLETGLETAYYDIREILNPNRRRVPHTPNALDWLHMNQCYLNETNNLIIVSARHQSAVFGFSADDSTPAFILANHQDWPERLKPYLLTPVDENGSPLYDLTAPEGIDKADKEFWTWGQHAVSELPNNTPGMVEFTVFDNGNYRSRDEEKALLPVDNGSRMVRYLVDLTRMTVRKVDEYGKAELGSRGYSSFVSNTYLLDNGNYLVNFGGNVVDENGRTQTGWQPGCGADREDPDRGKMAEGRVVLQEISADTHEVQIELFLRSGRLKSDNEGENRNAMFQECFCFRARKFSLFED